MGLVFTKNYRFDPAENRAVAILKAKNNTAL